MGIIWGEEKYVQRIRAGVVAGNREKEDSGVKPQLQKPDHKNRGQLGCASSFSNGMLLMAYSRQSL